MVFVNLNDWNVILDFVKMELEKYLESLFYILNQHFGNGEIVRDALES